MQDENLPHDPNKSPSNIYFPAIAAVASIAFGLYRYFDAVKKSDTYFPGFIKVFWFERLLVDRIGLSGIAVFWIGLGVILAVIAGIFFYRIKIKK